MNRLTFNLIKIILEAVVLAEFMKYGTENIILARSRIGQ